MRRLLCCFGAIVVGKGSYEINDGSPDLGIGYLCERTIEFDTFPALQKPADIIGVRLLGHAGQIARVSDIRRFVIEKLDVYSENTCQLEQTARAYSIHTLFVFLYLLKCQAKTIAKLLLAHSE